MNILMQFFLGFSAAAVFLGFLSMLCPEGNMKKSVKYGFSIIFLCASVTLFSTLNGISFKNAKPHGQSVESNTYLAETQAEYICAAVLQDNKIPFSEIKANISGTDSIYISMITVYTDFDKEKTASVIRSVLEVEEVKIIGGG